MTRRYGRSCSMFDICHRREASANLRLTRASSASQWLALVEQWFVCHSSAGCICALESVQYFARAGDEDDAFGFASVPIVDIDRSGIKVAEIHATAALFWNSRR